MLDAVPLKRFSRYPPGNVSQKRGAARRNLLKWNPLRSEPFIRSEFRWLMGLSPKKNKISRERDELAVG
jgi:hypothetical protein